jgi:hypothetical protein
MNCRSGALLVLPLVLFAGAAQASSLPPIATSPENEIPACATPGRIHAFLQSRNSDLDPRFEGIATLYMRIGEELGVRWDYAFFQMLLETGNLAYKRGNGRQGDVSPKQNNFAGLGAIGRGEPGESFRDVASGVKAHLQHVLMYSGATIADPVADRTRKVQEWSVLTSWQKSLKGPITFADLARKWAPGDGSYARQLQGIAAKFYERFCEMPDPAPHLVQEARNDRQPAKAAAKTASAATVAPEGERVSGAQLARQAVERAKAEGDATRSTLGAASIAKGKMTAEDGIDAVKTEKQVQTASAAAAGKQALSKSQAPQRAPANCRVFTASYGGQKSFIIKAQVDQYTNYTVLDVNEGSEARELEAYIAAYAKGGQKVGEFSNQIQALDKAFELCPEG